MKPSDVVGRVVQVTSALVALLLGVRFVLRAFNADATNRLVSWIYDTSSPAVEPFFEWFQPVRTGDGFNVEVQTLIALAVYVFVAFAMLAVVGLYRTRADAIQPKRFFSVTIKR